MSCYCLPNNNLHTNPFYHRAGGSVSSNTITHYLKPTKEVQMFKKGLLLATAVVLTASGCAPKDDVDTAMTAADNDIVNALLAEPVPTKLEVINEPLEANNTAAEEEPPADKNIAYEITEKDHAKTYARWGKEWVDSINTMMPLAVDKVASNEKCDSPSKVDLSDTRSTVKKEVVFYVDCENDERFYVNQAEILDPTPLVAESDALNEDEGAYTLACVELSKTKVEYPSSFKPIKPDVLAFKGSSGNMIVEVPFTTLNSYGADLPMLARCIFSTTGKTEVGITNR